jgi:Spy/CpxP family protein refolding chaperone
MKNRLTIFALIIAITLAVLSTASFADEQKNPTGPFGKTPYFSKQGERSPVETRGMFRGMMDLELSEEQTAEIKEVMLDLQKASIELKSEIQMKQLEFQELLLESVVDMESVRAKLEEIADLQVELKIKAIENQSKIKEVFTDEQLEKLSLDFPMLKFGMEGFDFKRGMMENQW